MQEIMNRAIQALSEGRVEDAWMHLAPLRETASGDIRVMMISGVAGIESGRRAEGQQWFDRALQQQPANPEIAYNHASALMKVGAIEEAVAQFQVCLSIAPKHVHALANRGVALEKLGKDGEARQSYQVAIRAAPNHVSAIYNLANLDLAAGNAREALDGFRRALDCQSDHAGAWLGLGRAQLDLGDPRQAAKSLRRSVDIDGTRADAWADLARGLTENFDLEGARDAAIMCTELEPNDPDHWNLLGTTWTTMVEFDKARKALERALSIDPDHLHALTNMAALLELANQLDEAANFLDRLDSSDPRVRAIRARVLQRTGDDEAAMTELLDLDGREDLDLGTAREVAFLLGKLHDKRRDADSAYDAFQRANRHSLEQFRAANREVDSLVPGLPAIANTFKSPGKWAVRQSDSMVREPAFLFGFQRSGTTLLDTVLGAHDQVTVMEELPAINRTIAAMARKFGPYPQHLPQLSDADLADLRQIYWREVGQLSGFEASPDTLLLDKSPLHTIHVGFIRMLFPQSRLIFALRHPIDVCFSCFMQDFTLTPFMAHYTSMDGVADVYGKVMDMWFAQRKHLAPSAHQIRYEELIEDPAQVIRAAVEYLELPWSDELLDHTGHAKSRGLINTPSYDQVSKPIYKSAAGRWERYRECFPEIVEQLWPYVEAHGYR